MRDLDNFNRLQENAWAWEGILEERSRGNDYYKDYVLCGTRPSKDKKKEFPNYLGIPGNAINTFESPLDAAVRTLREKANFNVELLDKKYEPSPVAVTFSKSKIIATMSFFRVKFLYLKLEGFL
jgi:hypothetical protein